MTQLSIQKTVLECSSNGVSREWEDLRPGREEEVFPRPA